MSVLAEKHLLKGKLGQLVKVSFQPPPSKKNPKSLLNYYEIHCKTTEAMMPIRIKLNRNRKNRTKKAPNELSISLYF